MRVQRSDYLSFFILGLHLLHPQRDSSVSIDFFGYFLCLFWEIKGFKKWYNLLNKKKSTIWIWNWQLSYSVQAEIVRKQLLCYGIVCSTSSFSSTAFHLLSLTICKIYISLSPHSYNWFFPRQQFSSSDIHPCSFIQTSPHLTVRWLH